MAIVWGAARGNFRLGIDLIDNGSSFTWIVYGESVAYGHNWNYTLSFSGSTGGSVTGRFQSNYGQTIRRELHRWNSGKVTYSVTATLNSALVPGATVSRGISVTPSPNAPSTLQATRVSDARHDLAWSRNSTYTEVQVDRRDNGGSWRRVATLKSNAASWSDTSTKANMRYEWRVRGRNAGGTSGWSNTVGVYTTPAAPTSVAARRQGDNIVITPTGGSTHAGRVDIQDDGVMVAENVPLPSWTHISPAAADPHRYRARHRIASGGTNSTTLYSAWSPYSPTVQLVSPPAAPTGLSPNGGVVPADERVTLRVTHNPVDTSGLTGFRFRYRAPGGSWTEATLAPVTDWPGYYQVTASRWASMLAGGNTIEWQAQTRGSHPDWGAWSASAVFEVATTPQVEILSPTDGDWFEAQLPVSWSWFQAEGRPQSQWRALLYRGNTLVETRTGTGDATSVTFRQSLSAGQTYRVEVSAATGEVWSDVDSVTITVFFIPPVPAELAGAWNDETGAMELEIAAEAWQQGVAYAEGDRVFLII